MNESEFYGIIERHAEQFAASATLAQFAASLDASKPGDGKVLQWLVAKYPDGYWKQYFATVKAHGFLSKALLMPDARKVTDLFESVMLAPMSGGIARGRIPYKAQGYAFVSDSRAKGFAYFGYLGAKYGFSANEWHRKAGRRVRAILRTNGPNWLTAAKPSAAMVAAVGVAGPGDWQSATYEAIQHSNGKILICERDNIGIGSGRWVALLDAGESALSMLGEHELGEIAAEQSAKLAGYGTDWIVTGTDRQQGAIGLSEPFSVTVPALSRDDAWQAAHDLQTGLGRGYDFLATDIRELGA